MPSAPPLGIRVQRTAWVLGINVNPTASASMNKKDRIRRGHNPLTQDELVRDLLNCKQVISIKNTPASIIPSSYMLKNLIPLAPWDKTEVLSQI
jgi:hypothetical protein